MPKLKAFIIRSSFHEISCVPCIVLKTAILNTGFQRKNKFEKNRPSLGRDLWENGLVWRAMLKNIFGKCGLFFKPIFALKPWDRDGRFE